MQLNRWLWCQKTTYVQRVNAVNSLALSEQGALLSFSLSLNMFISSAFCK